jgi:hypothetical protein
MSPLSSPNSAKCREKSAEIQRDIEKFLNRGGKITHLKSGLESEIKQHDNASKQAARLRGMQKFNGGIAK